MQVNIPDPFFGSTSAFATAWCDGTTRVHVVASNTSGYDGEGPHVAQTIEPNAALCGGHP